MPILTTPPPLVRLTEPSYADGSSAIARTDDAPLIASILFDQNEDMPNGAGLSPLFVDWGQFIDHDLDLTRDASGEIIQVTGLAGPFQRSNFTVEDLGDGQLLRTPVNEITAAIDANMIYGSTGDRLADIRSFEGGRVRTGEVAPDGRSLMPFAGETDVMAGGEATDSPIFFAGDVRANENIALTMLHTVFVREHNHWADRLAAENPEWDDDTLFQTARAIVEYELQTITYRDWLPTLLAGRPEAETLAESLTTSLSEEESNAVDGQISVEFSTAAFRFGHTMVSSLVPLLDERGVQSDELSLAVADVVFNVQPLVDGYLDDLMRGSAATLAQEVDGKVIDDLNFFLRAPDGVTGFSLAALNILRGRDHGLTTYLEARADLLGDIDLETIAADDFSVITSDATVQNDLNAVYDSVFDVDLWVGGLTEDRPAGTLMGPLFSHILVEQFDRTWRADSSFQDLPDGLSAALLAEIESQDINAIIMRNTGLAHLQDNPFVAAARFSTDGSGTDVSGTSLGDFLFGDDLANSLIGLDGDDTVFAEAGNDTIEGGSGNDEIAGGPGVDSLQLSGSDQEYHVAFYQDGTVKVEHKVTGGDGTDHLTGVEKIEFANGFWEMGVFDGIMSLSEGEIRSLVELYVAMFGRAPDATGLCFWGDVMANGMTLDEIAGHFFDQDEFRALYPDLSDSGALVDAIYQNVLNRAADTEGRVFWTSVIEEGALGPEKLVLAVLEGARAAAPDGTAPDFVAQKAADVAYLQGLVDLGVLFSAIKGLNDVDAAGTVMDTFDGGQPSLDAALDLIEAAYDAAVDPETGSFLVSLVGVIDDPFATGDIGMG